MITWLVLSALSIVALGGGWCLVKRDGWGRWQSLFGCVALLGLALAVLAGADEALVDLAWGLPVGRFALRVDPTSAVFLSLFALVGGAVVIYGERAWSLDGDPHDARRLRIFAGLSLAAMGLVVIAADGVLLLIAWEVAAVSCFFLVSAEDDDPECRAAGWRFLIAAQLVTLLLIALFALIASQTGSFALAALPESLPSGVRGAIFFLALGAFGVMAGLMPLHLWIPAAHDQAPSYVSALLSGVMMALGIYGLVRVFGLIPQPPAVWAWLLLAVGVVTALVGVLLALSQRNLMRMLAYHGVANTGVIVIGLGLAMLGRAHGEPSWIALGLGGALLHTLNHGLAKSLLFLAAGAVQRVTATALIDRLGGLARMMPRTSALFLFGTLAVCALPPLAGFTGQLLLYLGLVDATVADPALASAGGGALGAALAIPALALFGGLVIACFVKAYGITFGGHGRSPAANRAREPHRDMQLAMAALAVICLAIGVVPALAVPLLDGAVAGWPSAAPTPALAEVAPLVALTALALGLLAVVVGSVWLLSRHLRRHRGDRPATTWNGAFAPADARLQYSGSSLSSGLVRVFAWLLRPVTQRPRLGGPLPAPSTFFTRVGEPIRERILAPAQRRLERLFARLEGIERRRIQSYVLYLLLGLFALFMWHLLPFDQLLSDLGARGAHP